MFTQKKLTNIKVPDDTIEKIQELQSSYQKALNGTDLLRPDFIIHVYNSEGGLIDVCSRKDAMLILKQHQERLANHVTCKENITSNRLF